MGDMVPMVMVLSLLAVEKSAGPRLLPSCQFNLVIYKDTSPFRPTTRRPSPRLDLHARTARSHVVDVCCQACLRVSRAWRKPLAVEGGLKTHEPQGACVGGARTSPPSYQRGVTMSTAFNYIPTCTKYSAATRGSVDVVGESKLRRRGKGGECAYRVLPGVE